MPTFLRRAAIIAALAAAILGTRPAPAQDAPPYQVERSAVHTVVSKAVEGRTYQLYVKLPPGYGDPANAGRRYPVLYLTDGDYTFQVASGVTRLPHNTGKLEPVILVGLSYAQGEDGMVSRRRDLTPWPNPTLPSPTGGARAYLDFITREAIPLVEGRYRADPARRTLVGQSFGGLFGLWVALTEPGHFESYILTSPSIWYADEALHALEAAHAAKHKDLKARLYMATGGFETLKPGANDPRYNKTNDMVGAQGALARRLTSRKYPGLKVRADVIEGTIHDTTFPVGFVHGMTWLYGG